MITEEELQKGLHEFLLSCNIRELWQDLCGIMALDAHEELARIMAAEIFYNHAMKQAKKPNEALFKALKY